MRPDQIRKRIQLLERKVGQALMNQISQALTQYKLTNITPDEALFESHIDLLRSAEILMDSSIGGSGYTEALQDYDNQLVIFERVCADYGLI